MLTRNSQIETRRAPASVSPQSYKADSRTFEAVISTGANVQRRDATGPYTESLDLSAIDLASLKGVPVLTEHSSGDFNAHVGTIESARFVQGNLVANIRLTSASNADVAAQKIQDGVLHSLSIGYSVSQWADGKDPQTGSRVRTAKVWEIKEVSLVAMPADKGATVRNQNMETQTEIIKPIVPDVIAHRALVRDIAKRSGMDANWADTQIDSGNEIASIKALAHDAMMSRSQTIRVQPIGNSGDDPAVILQRRIDGLHSKTTGATPKPEAREFANDSLSDHVRSMLESSGVSTRGLSKIEIFQRAANTVSDFPALLTGVGARTLLPAYEASRSPLVKIFAKQSRNDFRANYNLRISEMGSLSKVSESGEIKSVGRSELQTSYLIDTYAGMFTLTRKAIINDDLGAFTDSAKAFGLAAATTEAMLMVALLESNPVMQEDNTALFHAAKHGNLAAVPSIIDTINLSIARKALRDSKGLDGKTPIAVAPKYLIVSSDLETMGEQALAILQPTKTADVNPFGGKLELLVDPRLAQKTWYLAGDPSQIACLSYAVLGGAEAPTVEIQNLFDTLGTSVRCYHDFGVGAQDWRGLFKNVGV